MNSGMPVYKIVVLGEGRVGKTSMTLKFIRNQFNDDQESSINVCYLQKVVKLKKHDQKAKLAIWDTAGQEKYNAIAPVYYRDAIGAIVVYQIVSTQSFQKVKKWVNELRDHANNKDIVIVIVGNKSDMENQRRVDPNDAQDFAKECNATHILVSAKSGANINELFVGIADLIYQQKLKRGESQIYGMRRNPRLFIENHKTEKSSTSTKKKDCCK